MGCEALIGQLEQQLTKHKFLAIFGASGSGKSSVVLAGLIPFLQKKQPDLVMVYLTPSSNPIQQLETSLPQPQNQALIIVIDQFEELFTLCTDQALRLAFIKQLLIIVKEQLVVITMRADFWGECASYPELKELMQSRQELIGPMDTTELRKAMEMQAIQVGLRFEAGLSNSILDDVQGEPGAMPLLQHALLELWKGSKVSPTRRVLKPSKTRLAHTLTEYKGEKSGFIFLGFNICQYPAGKYQSGKNTYGEKLGFKTIITPSKQKQKEHYDQIAKVIDAHKASTASGAN